jgi:hypothetical protein
MAHGLREHTAGIAKQETSSTQALKKVSAVDHAGLRAKVCDVCQEAQRHAADATLGCSVMGSEAGNLC